MTLRIRTLAGCFTLSLLMWSGLLQLAGCQSNQPPFPYGDQIVQYHEEHRR